MRNANDVLFACLPINMNVKINNGNTIDPLTTG